jgi:hypothetical protein
MLLALYEIQCQKAYVATQVVLQEPNVAMETIKPAFAG